MPEDSAEYESGTYRCSACTQTHDGYHDCPAGPDRVQFTCSSCGEEIDREVYKTDIKGITPARCTDCVFELMGEP